MSDTLVIEKLDLNKEKLLFLEILKKVYILLFNVFVKIFIYVYLQLLTKIFKIKGNVIKRAGIVYLKKGSVKKTLKNFNYLYNLL